MVLTWVSRGVASSWTHASHVWKRARSCVYAWMVAGARSRTINWRRKASRRSASVAEGGADLTRIIWSPFHAAYFAYNTENHGQIIRGIRYICIIPNGGVVLGIVGRSDGENASEKGLNYACNTLTIVSVRILCVPHIDEFSLVRQVCEVSCPDMPFISGDRALEKIAVPLS